MREVILITAYILSHISYNLISSIEISIMKITQGNISKVKRFSGSFVLRVRKSEVVSPAALGGVYLPVWGCSQVARAWATEVEMAEGEVA